jgi:hypothetical protein
MHGACIYHLPESRQRVKGQATPLEPPNGSARTWTIWRSIEGEATLRENRSIERRIETAAAVDVSGPQRDIILLRSEREVTDRIRTDIAYEFG